MGAPSWAARLGILVIHNDPVVETELWAMAPPGVTVHTARFESPTSGGAEYTGTRWEDLVDAPDVARGLRQLGRPGVSAICFRFGSASFFGGAEFDDRFAAAATGRAGGTPARTAEEACRQVRTAFPAGADGVLIPGSGFRSREAIGPVERELGVPVVTSDHAVLWDLLRLAGVPAAVPHAGRLITAATMAG
jgi:maleate cis-trans isomerase